MIREHYSHKIADGEKAKKKYAARDRAAARAKRSSKEQLTRLDEGGHRAVKERKRLE